MRTVAVSCCSRGRLFLSALGFAGSPQVGGPTRFFIPYFSIFKNGFWGVAISEGPFPKKRPPALRGPYPLLLGNGALRGLLRTLCPEGYYESGELAYVPCFPLALFQSTARSFYQFSIF